MFDRVESDFSAQAIPAKKGAGRAFAGHARAAKDDTVGANSGYSVGSMRAEIVSKLSKSCHILMTAFVYLEKDRDFRSANEFPQLATQDLP